MEFDYRCIDPSGRAAKGSITADGLTEAKSLLKERGLTVVRINAGSRGEARKFSLRKGVKDTDLYNMFRELSILIKSGIKIDRAMEILLNSVSNIQLKKDVSAILRDIKAGKTLASAFIDTGRFSLLSTAMIQAGEGAGNIRSAFENIAEYQRFQMQFKSEIRNALAYPAFLIFASILTIFVIFKFIMPRFFSIFGKDTASLPLTAKILYSISNFLSLANIYLFIIAAAAIYVLIRKYKAKNLFSRAYYYLAYAPLIGKLILYLELSRFSYSMYSMLNSGIEFINALKLSCGIIMDKRIRESIEPAINRIKEGKGIADTFSHIGILPDIVPNMLRVGEESGSLREIFFEIYRVFDERFKNTTKRILSLVEPVVITITGIIVGFIVISLILTVMSTGSIKL